MKGHTRGLLDLCGLRDGRRYERGRSRRNGRQGDGSGPGRGQLGLHDNGRGLLNLRGLRDGHMYGRGRSRRGGRQSEGRGRGCGHGCGQRGLPGRGLLDLRGLRDDRRRRRGQSRCGGRKDPVVAAACAARRALKAATVV